MNTTTTEATTQIHRFPIDAGQDLQSIETPAGAVFIEGGLDPMRPGEQALWFEIDTEAEGTEQRLIQRSLVGHTIPAPSHERILLFRGLGTAKSESRPGDLSTRTAFFWELLSLARGHAIDTLQAVADATSE